MTKGIELRFLQWELVDQNQTFKQARKYALPSGEVREGHAWSNSKDFGIEPVPILFYRHTYPLREGNIDLSSALRETGDGKGWLDYFARRCMDKTGEEVSLGLELQLPGKRRMQYASFSQKRPYEFKGIVLRFHQFPASAQLVIPKFLYAKAKRSLPGLSPKGFYSSAATQRSECLIAELDEDLRLPSRSGALLVGTLQESDVLWFGRKPADFPREHYIEAFACVDLRDIKSNRPVGIELRLVE